MSYETIYTCDLCGKKSKKEMLKGVPAVLLKFGNNCYSENHFGEHYSDTCNSCADIIKANVKRVVEETASMLRVDIISQMGQD